MISIIKESRQDFSFLLKLHHLSPEQKSDIESAICAEGDSDSYDCGDYLLVIPNDDFTTFDKMSKVIRSLMDKYGERAPDVNESWHYKFEDLKPLFASEIQGGMDPNDEYYPRQKVDDAICELDAHRLCFDTDRKYYMEQYDKTLKRWMDSENRLLHSNYRRICRILKDCRKKLLEWQRLCTIFQDPKAIEVAKAKVVLWQKWEARWQELANRYGGNYDG
jgi:hypothetical protein